MIDTEVVDEKDNRGKGNAGVCVDDGIGGGKEKENVIEKGYNEEERVYQLVVVSNAVGNQI